MKILSDSIDTNFGPSQKDMVLSGNDIPHLLGAKLESVQLSVKMHVILANSLLMKLHAT